jgi:hypothetical protein
VQAAVSRAVAEVDQRERNLQAAAEPPGRLADPQQALEQARARCQALETCAAGAAGKVAAVSAALAEAEEALQRWLHATGAAREKLAAWVGRAVG